MHKTVAPAAVLAPPLRAVPFLKTTAEPEAPLLTDRQRRELARIGMRLRLPPRMTIYRADAEAHWVFAVAEGAVKCYRELPSGKRIIGAFLFARDLFGLAENGRYMNSAQTITRVTLFRLPINELAVLLKHDADMQFHFLSKVTHELRESQRRAVLITRRDAPGRLAMFLALMGARPHMAAHPLQIPLPMTRADIAGYLGLSVESVSRAAAELERRGLVSFENRYLARILHPGRFAKLAAAV